MYLIKFRISEKQIRFSIIDKIFKQEKINEKISRNTPRIFKTDQISAAGIPFLLNCQSDSLAQKSNESILSSIKKNARSVGTEGMGAIDVPEWFRQKSFWLAKRRRVADADFGNGFQNRRQNARAEYFDLFLSHRRRRHLRQKRRTQTRKISRLAADGRKRQIRISTIKPASYPKTTFSSHVHMTLTGKDFREDWIEIDFFEGDKFITERERNEAGQRGGFNPIITLEKRADGIWYGTRDIKLLS